MLDLGLVDKALSGDGKDADDRRLSAVEAATVSDVLLAADAARIGLEAGSTDIRLLVAYLLGVFVEQGPTALAPIFDALAAAVGERWHSLRPEAGRPEEPKERVVDGSLTRLFRSMVNHVDVHEKMADATFKAWSRVDHDSVGGPALRASSTLREALDAALESPKSTAQLSELDARIRSHFDRFPAPAKPVARPAPEPEPEPAPEVAPANEEAEPTTDEQPAAASPGEGSWNAESTPRADAEWEVPLPKTVTVSPAFGQLLRKIQAVRVLLARGETERAAVVADDVRRTLKAFDPKVFFPDVFLPHFQLLSQNIDAIAPYWGEETDSPRWEALVQLCQVNLDAFVKG